MVNKILVLILMVGCNHPVLKKPDPLSYHATEDSSKWIALTAGYINEACGEDIVGYTNNSFVLSTQDKEVRNIGVIASKDALFISGRYGTGEPGAIGRWVEQLDTIFITEYHEIDVQDAYIRALMHELGHAMYLHHNDHQRSVMYKYLMPYKDGNGKWILDSSEVAAADIVALLKQGYLALCPNAKNEVGGDYYGPTN